MLITKNSKLLRGLRLTETTQLITSEGVYNCTVVYVVRPNVFYIWTSASIPSVSLTFEQLANKVESPRANQNLSFGLVQVRERMWTW